MDIGESQIEHYREGTDLLSSYGSETGGHGQGPRRHVCSLFKNDSDQFSAIIPFMLNGVRRNDKCLYAADSMEKEELFDRLMDASPVGRDVLETRISFVSVDDVYLNGTSFDKGRMLKFIADQQHKAISEGYSGLTAAGEMSWAARAVQGTSDLIEYEARINLMYPGASCDLLCQYPESDFDAATLVNAIRAHPKVVVRGVVCGNPYYLPPETLISYAAGVVTPEALARMEKEMFNRAILSDIAALESRDLRRASLYLKVFDEMILSHFPDQLEALSFMHEVALGSGVDEALHSNIRSADSKCRDLMDRLEAVRAFKACIESPSGWQSLESAVHVAAEATFGGSREIKADVGSHRVFTSSSLDKILGAVLYAVAERGRADSPIEVHAVPTPFGLTVTVGAEGKGVPEGAKESLFEACRPCVCGRSLFLAREILELTGAMLREVGIPGKTTVFQIDFPPRHSRA